MAITCVCILFVFFFATRPHVRQNRNQLELKAGVSLKEAHDAEMTFFQKHPVFGKASRPRHRSLLCACFLPPSPLDLCKYMLFSHLLSLFEKKYDRYSASPSILLHIVILFIIGCTVGWCLVSHDAGF